MLVRPSHLNRVASRLTACQLPLFLLAATLLAPLSTSPVHAQEPANGKGQTPPETPANQQPDKDEGDKQKGDQAKADDWKPLTRAQLRKKLNRVQFYVTQQEGTEEAFRNEYWDNKRKGTYLCIVCEKPLFNSDTKFVSGTGWPSFWQPLNEDAVGTKTDFKLFYPRTEVHCSRCGAHLGHVFDDGPRPTGLRYCMNSASLKFIEQDKADKVTQSDQSGGDSPDK